MSFENRRDAGRRLARLLEPHVHRPAVVYALPRGGVPLAVDVALGLRLPLDLVMARKIGHPQQPEYAVGAVTETGVPVIAPHMEHQLDPGWLARRVAEERAEAQRRRKVYGGGHPRLSAAGKCAILVDDGIATGLTMEAAIDEIRGDAPRWLVVATAVAPREAATRFAALCDDFVAVEIPEHYAGSVGAYYESFPQLSDQAVLDELARLGQALRPSLQHLET